MNYQVEELEINGVPRLGITLNEYPDHQFVLGAIEFVEVDGKCVMKYNYDMVVNTAPLPIDKFEKAIGDFVLHYLEQQAEHPVVFTGGT